MFISRVYASKVPARNLLRLLSKLAPAQRCPFAPIHFRLASSTTRTSPTRVAISSHGSMKLPPRPELSPEQLQAVHNAEKLYQAGKTVLFRAPSHSAYLLGSWALGLGCLSATMWLIYLGHWKDDPESQLPWFVPVSYRLSMFTISGLGLWILLRSTRLVTAIDLVQHAGKGKMRVSVRRIVPVPFVPRRRLFVAPYDLRMSRSTVSPGQVPDFAMMPREDDHSKPLRFGTWAGRKISHSLWSFFAGNRKIFTHEGFLYVTIKGQGQFKIDLEGSFPNGAQSLVDVSTFATD